MQSNFNSGQRRCHVTVGGEVFTIEMPANPEALLDRVAVSDPQNVDAIPYYATLWPAALGLAHFLAREYSTLEACRVLELGCGLGLPAIVAARVGATVVATDFHPDTGQWLLHNAHLNQVVLAYLAADWGALTQMARPPIVEAPFDLLIGSDLLYEKRHIPALVCAINNLCAIDGEVIIADPGRDNLALFVSSMEHSNWHFTLHAQGASLFL